MVSSREFWTTYQVADFNTITAEESLAMLEWRNGLYPVIEELMPTTHRGRVLDFGCGPGHDTVGFLLNGAEHVVAADFSPKAVEMTKARVRAHEFENVTVELTDEDWIPPRVDHVHTAGVIHHCEDPVGTLALLAANCSGEIRMMVYDSASWFYRVKCESNPDTFRRGADAGAPIVHAWTQEEVAEIAQNAGLTATYLGSYLQPGEPEGPGLSACYSLS